MQHLPQYTCICPLFTVPSSSFFYLSGHAQARHGYNCRLQRLQLRTDLVHLQDQTASLLSSRL